MKNCPFCAEEIQDAAAVCKHCGRELSPHAKGKTSHTPTWVQVFVLGTLLLVAYAVLKPTASRRFGPLVISLNDTTFSVPAGGYEEWNWQPDPAHPNCHVEAHFTGLAGSHKDFFVLLVDDDGFANFRNNAEGRAYFNSGQSSSVTVSSTVVGTGSRYHLIVSNRFSAVTTKLIQLRGGRVTCTS